MCRSLSLTKFFHISGCQSRWVLTLTCINLFSITCQVQASPNKVLSQPSLRVPLVSLEEILNRVSHISKLSTARTLSFIFFSLRSSTVTLRWPDIGIIGLPAVLHKRQLINIFYFFKLYNFSCYFGSREEGIKFALHCCLTFLHSSPPCH